MGQSTFPVPSSGSSTSTILPVNASSVILDGSLTSASTYTTTINGNGGIAYLTATDNPATITVGGTAYSVPSNTVVASKAFGSSTSVTVATITIPSTFFASTLSSNWISVAYGLVGTTNTFVALATNQGTVASYSTDGINWTASTMPSSDRWCSVAYGNGVFVAMQNTGNLFSTNTNAASSTNGTTWTARTMPTSNSWASTTYGLISGTGYYVAVAGYGIPFLSAVNSAASSTNGTSWTARTLPSTQSWSSVAYGNSRFIAVASYNNAGGATAAGAYSTTGTSWTAMTMPSTSTWTAAGYGLVGATDYWIAATTGTAGGYSTNGTTWTASTMPSSSGYNSIAFGSGYFVAVGSTAMAYSSTGTTWTAGTMPSSGWNGVTYGNNTFVAVQGSGISTSAYVTLNGMPVNFGIYAGPTTIN